jgi:ferric-dicitrate binding protein FerR (iron transport regulator)
MKDQELYHIIERELTGDISGEERSRLEAWLAHSSENREVYQRMEMYWRLTGSMKAGLDIDTESALERLKTKIDGKKDNVIRIWTYRVAAAILFIAVAGVIFMNIRSGNKYEEFQTGDQIEEIHLSDGSTVTLNRNSSLWYKEDMLNRKERKVRLAGEAFFEVARNEESPFKVEIDQTIVEVLGTSFNIQAYQNRELTEISVNTGEVGFYKINDPENMLTLEAGDQAVYNRNRNIILKVETEDPNYLSWKVQEFVFKDTSMEMVFNTLENYFDINFIIDNPTITNCTFTGTFSDPRLDEVLEVIGLSLNLKFIPEQNNYLVDGDGCELD